MGNPTLKERIKWLIADFGWKMFIWGYYHGNEDAYRQEVLESL